jgi:hypothetical protein
MERERDAALLYIALGAIENRTLFISAACVCEYMEHRYIWVREPKSGWMRIENCIDTFVRCCSNGRGPDRVPFHSKSHKFRRVSIEVRHLSLSKFIHHWTSSCTFEINSEAHIFLGPLLFIVYVCVCARFVKVSARMAHTPPIRAIKIKFSIAAALLSGWIYTPLKKGFDVAAPSQGASKLYRPREITRSIIIVIALFWLGRRKEALCAAHSSVTSMKGNATK